MSSFHYELEEHNSETVLTALRANLSTLRDLVCIKCGCAELIFTSLIVFGESSAGVDQACSKCGAKRFTPLTIYVPCLLECPACNKTLFNDNAKPTGPDRFDYPSRCESCKMRIAYSAHKYRIKVLERGTAAPTELFEASFGAESDLWAAKGRFSGTQYVFQMRGPDWRGGSTTLGLGRSLA